MPASLGGEPWGNNGETTVVSLRATSCGGPCVPSALFPAYHRLPPLLFHHELDAAKLWAKISHFSQKCLRSVLWPWWRRANGYGKSRACPIGSRALYNILHRPLSAGDLHAWLTCFFWKIYEAGTHGFHFQREKNQSREVTGQRRWKTKLRSTPGSRQLRTRVCHRSLVPSVSCLKVIKHLTSMSMGLLRLCGKSTRILATIFY